MFTQRFMTHHGIAYGFALVALLLVPHSAQAQVTVEMLTSSAVSDVGPYYEDVKEAINRFFGGDVEGALNLLSAAKKKTPKLAPPEVMLAQLFILTGKGPAARQQLEKAIENSPDDPEAYLILADIAFAEGRVTEANLLCAKASALAAKFSETPERKQSFQTRSFVGMATAEEARKNWAGAKESLSAWVQHDPSSAAAHQRLARALFQLDDKKGAYAELQAAVKADSKAAPAEVVMGNYYAQGPVDKTQAEKFMTAAAKKGADNLATNIALAQYYVQMNDLSAALTHAEAALKIDPKSVEAKTLRGAVARRQKDYVEAKKWLEAAHAQSPANADAMNELALALIEQKDTADHLRAMEFAVLNQKVNPNNLEIMATLGWVAYRAGRKADAQRALNAISGRLTPESAYYVAFVMKDEGRLADAIKLLDLALDNDKPFPYRQEAESLLADLRKKQKDKPASEPKKDDSK